MIDSKQPQPVFLSIDEAEKHCQAGASIWKFASTDDGLDPDVVLVGIDSALSFEVVAAASILRRLCPALRVRVVNVTDLMILEARTRHPHSLTNDEFSSLLTAKRPIHFNYHGYSNEIRGLTFGRHNLERVGIECYKEEGRTTTRFDVMLRNNVSGYHVTGAASKRNQKAAPDMTGKDPDGTFDVPKFERTEFRSGAKGGGGAGGKEDGFFMN